MRNKLLVICGPTATGKTSLALHLARQLEGEIVSADSRQVYKNMDIGTGKDLPNDFEFQPSGLKLGRLDIGSYTDGLTHIWGYDLVEPKRDFSVTDYMKAVGVILKDVYSRDKLPIIAGGTGFYIKAVIDGLDTAGVPKDKKLRESLKHKSAEELFETLSVLDPVKSASMNVSDKKNPRRLIRAIEVAQHERKNGDRNGLRAIDVDFNMIGLKLKKKSLYKRIEIRVEKRLKDGIESEIKKLLESGVSWGDQSMNTLGYKEWAGYFEGGKKIEQVIKEWKSDEKNYAKRQMTWFKKDKRINWFEAGSKNLHERVEKKVRQWYKMN